jgi:hypothetical protein
VIEDVARLAHDGPKLEVDCFKIGIDPLAAGALKGVQQPVFWRKRFSDPGHLQAQRRSSGRGLSMATRLRAIKSFVV